MRTDHKIGIAAVVLLGVVITTWTALNSGPEAEPDPGENTAQPADGNRGDDQAADYRDPLGGGSFYERREGRVAESLTGGIIGEGRTTGDRTGGTATGDPGDSLPGSAGTDEMADARRAAELAMGGRTGDASGGTSGRGPDWWSGTRAAAETRGRTTTYTVKEADQGFWTVAKNVYGNGKHWALIAKANPDADSNTLRAGQILKIPSLPATAGNDRTAGSRAAETGRNGQLATAADGKQYYYVQKGDAGFWAVSVKAYGNGKHWALIAQANPNVTSGSLNEGQKLLVPPRPATATGATAAVPGRTLKPGEKWYTVVEGDAGFWDVARKSYGAGKHWAVIAGANPNVNSGRLRKGQKLLVPPLSASPRRTTPSSGSRVTRSDIPNFE